MMNYPRGGVPICWPSFGPWSEGPQHGFARSSVWSVDEEARTESSVTLELGGTELWPGHKFRLRYTVSLGEDGGLELELTAANCSEDKTLSFTSALHTYFRYKSQSTRRSTHRLRLYPTKILML